jgi:D-alanine-D-alanine ligase
MSAQSLKVVVLAGGISHEREVSLRSGRRVADALTEAGHHVTIVDPDAQLFSYLNREKPDVVWPAVHGASGEDGALLDLLEANGTSYVGPVGSSARLAWNKAVAKTLVGRAGVDTPLSITLPREAFRELGAAAVLDVVPMQLGHDLVVKPVHGGSSQGVSLVASIESLPRAMVDAYTYSDLALIEQRVYGTEVAVTVVNEGNGAYALPVVEIVPSAGFYSFEARYNAGETTFFTPARLSDSVLASVADCAVAVHETLGLDYISRIDFIVSESGSPIFLEANSLPGLTETSSAPLAMSASGRDAVSLFEALVRRASGS